MPPWFLLMMGVNSPSLLRQGASKGVKKRKRKRKKNIGDFGLGIKSGNLRRTPRKELHLGLISRRATAESPRGKYPRAPRPHKVIRDPKKAFLFRFFHPFYLYFLLFPQFSFFLLFLLFGVKMSFSLKRLLSFCERICSFT